MTADVRHAQGRAVGEKRVALMREVGWAMSETMPQASTARALDVALSWRNPEPACCTIRTAGRDIRERNYGKRGRAGTDAPAGQLLGERRSAL